MHKTLIDGIRQVLKECWNIYESTDEQVNYFQRLAVLKLAKECNETQIKIQIQQQRQQQKPQLTNQISR
jgi:hypothetical protein